MSDKNANLKEKLKQALASTFRVISDDFQSNEKVEENKNLSKFPKMNLSKALELEKRIINLPSGVEICQKK